MCAFIFQLKNKYGDAFLRGNNGMYSCKDVVPHTHQSSNMFKSGLINPLHPDINLHILYTVVLDTFPKVLIRRICFIIKSFFNW